MIRHAIIKDGIVINTVEYDTIHSGKPPGFEEGTTAIQNDTASPGWLYENGVFTDPTPPPPPLPVAAPQPTIQDIIDVLPQASKDALAAKVATK